MMTISVCMAAYNGAKYIEEQLKSLLDQSRRPDQVVLYDDGSEDGTVEIIRQFIGKNGLESGWRLWTGEKNLGYPACFYHAMDLCTEDIVFLADQDDIWDREKVEKMSRLFEEHRNLKAAVCKFGLIDAEGRRIRTVLAPTRNKNTGVLRHVSVEAVLRKGEWPGMVMAYRREWYRSWARGSKVIPHDLLISVKAAEEDGFLQIDEVMAFHRRHDDNAGGEEHRAETLLNRERKLWEIRVYMDYLEAFAGERILETEAGRAQMAEKYRTMQDRYAALKSARIGRVLKSALKHRRHVRPATVVCDVLICRQKERKGGQSL